MVVSNAGYPGASKAVKAIKTGELDGGITGQRTRPAMPLIRPDVGEIVTVVP